MASTILFAVAVISTVPPSATSLAEAVTLVISSGSTPMVTVDETVAVSAASPLVSVAVTVMVASPVSPGVSVSIEPLALAMTDSSFDDMASYSTVGLPLVVNSPLMSTDTASPPGRKSPPMATMNTASTSA